MGRFYKLLFVLAAVIFNACDEEALNPEHYSQHLSDMEKKLIGDWQYEYIEVNNVVMLYADENLNPVKTKSQRYGGERSVLSRRWINYSVERNYQLRWIRSTYQLGTEGDPNWQPNFGDWHLNEKGDSLFHNAGHFYTAKYKLTITTINGRDQLTRTSKRYMSSDSPQNVYKKGDETVFKEVFVRRK